MPTPTKPPLPSLLVDRPPETRPDLGLQIETAGEQLQEIYSTLLAGQPLSASQVLNTIEALLKVENALFELLP